MRAHKLMELLECFHILVGREDDNCGCQILALLDHVMLYRSTYQGGPPQGKIGLHLGMWHILGEPNEFAIQTTSSSSSILAHLEQGNQWGKTTYLLTRTTDCIMSVCSYSYKSRRGIQWMLVDFLELERHFGYASEEFSPTFGECEERSFVVPSSKDGTMKNTCVCCIHQIMSISAVSRRRICGQRWLEREPILKNPRQWVREWVNQQKLMHCMILLVL
jgi:hypothetical protein